MADDDQIRQALLSLALERGPGKTFCPSEAARTLAGDTTGHWRDLMPRVRQIAGQMPQIAATQSGAIVDPVLACGPIRLGVKG